MAAYLCMPVKWFAQFMFPEDRPSPIFTTFSCLINAVAGIWSVSQMGGDHCDGNTKTWLILGIMNCVFNLVFSVYMYCRFASKIRKGQGAGEAAWKMFLYDVGVCFYVMFVVWVIVWIALAVDKNSGAKSEDECGKQLGVLALLSSLYLAIGVFLIIVSLITECCRRPSWYQQQQEQPARRRSTLQPGGQMPRAAPYRVTQAPQPGQQVQSLHPQPSLPYGQQPVQQQQPPQQHLPPVEVSGPAQPGFHAVAIAAEGQGSAPLPPPALNPEYVAAEQEPARAAVVGGSGDDAAVPAARRNR